jgi:hypothetical protein
MNNYLKVFLSIAFGAVFLWLAFKNVAFSEVIEAARGRSWWWFIPFTITTLFSHFIRALRWRMLFEDKENLPHVSTLYSGVLFGYLTNIPFPRLGEVARPVYVARQIGESNSKVIGTVVLDRIVDVVSMLFIMVLVAIFLISDAKVLSNLFGVDVTDPQVYTAFVKGSFFYGLILLVAILSGFFILKKLSAGTGKFASFFYKVRNSTRKFITGVMSIRQLENWPLFIFYTALIWVAYITMTFLPFFMFDFAGNFGMSYTDAIVLTMVSAVGISIPTPGGIGGYHLVISYSLLMLYAVPEATGLAFATVSLAATIVVILISSPALLALEKYLALKREAAKDTIS